jgi:serine phosphatase RsbU (regulator of sigma subunit)
MMSLPDDNSENSNEKTGLFTTDTIKLKVDPHQKLPPCLVLLSGPTDLLGKQWILSQPVTILGRISTADISIPEPSLSKNHAQFRRAGELVQVIDLDSTNKTLLNEKAIKPNSPLPLKNNDLIRTGNLIFKFLERGILSETHEKARMQSELESAKALQESFLPAQKEADYPGHHISGYYRAASEISGDWWWHWAHGSSTFTIIGDTTGHGASSALMTSAARSAMATLEQNPTVTLDKVYRTLSHAIHSVSGGRFTMSAFLLEIDHADQSLKFINASHLPAIVLPKDLPNLTWSQLEHFDEPVSVPLGTPNPKLAIGLREAPLNSRVLLCTDGLTERKDPHGQQIKERSFYQILIDSNQKHPETSKDFISDLIRKSDELCGTDRNEDDITVVVIDFRIAKG